MGSRLVSVRLWAQRAIHVEQLIAEIPEMEKELKALEAAHTKVSSGEGGQGEGTLRDTEGREDITAGCYCTRY